MCGSVQREVHGAGPRRRLRTAGRSPVGSDLRRAAGRRGQGQRRWSRSAIRAGPSPTCAAYLEGRARLPRPASTASAVAPCAPLWSTSCPTTARPTTRPHLPRAVVTLDTPGKFTEFLRVTELDDAEWTTPPPLPPCTAKPFDGPQGAPTVPGAAKARREYEMDGCGSGDVGQTARKARCGVMGSRSPVANSPVADGICGVYGTRSGYGGVPLRCLSCRGAIFSPSPLFRTTVAPTMINRSPRDGRELDTWLHQPPCGERGNQSLQHRP